MSGGWRSTWRPGRAALKAAALAAVLITGGAVAASAAYNNAAVGGPMSVSTASLTAASGLTASRSCSSPTNLGTSLSWTASPSAATSGYSILRSTASSGPYSSVGTVSGAATTSYTDSMAPPAAADSLYVAVKSANGMDVVSLSSGTKTGNSSGPNLKNPTAIAVTPDGATAYLANSGANTVTPVTLSNDTAGSPVAVGTKPPTGLAVTSDGTQVWVADGTGNVVTPVTVSTNTAGTQINVGFNATAIAITPDGTTAWVAGQSNVISMNLTTLALGTKLAQGGATFTSIAITPDGSTAYVTDSANKKVWPLTLSTGAWGTGISMSFAPAAVAVSPGGSTAWVAGQTYIQPITLATATLGTAVIVSGANFQGIAITPNGCTVYAADASPSNRIVPVSTTSGTQGTPITTDTSPQDIATAYPHATYYYEVEATRNLWTSAPTGMPSESFGQPPLSVAPSPPVITSASAATFTANSAGTFTVTATGGPTPSLTETGTLPSGVTFTDNANGTATISGTTTAAGAYPLTITATNSQGSATQNFLLDVYSTSFVTSGNATAGTTVTSANFTLNASSAYLVLAATHDASAGTNTMSVGVGTAFTSNPAFTQIGAQQHYDSNGMHYTAWYLTGGSGSGTVSVALTNATSDAYVEIIQIGGANTTSPVVTATEGFNSSGNTAGTTATANLAGAPSAGDYELVFQNNAGDAGKGAPTSSDFTLVASSYLHGGGGSGVSLSAFGGAPVQSGSLTITSQIWGTMSLEIAHP